MTGFYKCIGLCAVLFAVHVTGIDFAFSRDKVVIGTGSTGTLTLTCDVTENDVATIYAIQIWRESQPGLGSFITLAEMDTGNTEPTIKVTNDKGFVAGGTFDVTTPGNTYLSVSMNISKLQCNDARAYKCVLSYKSTELGTIKSVEENGTFSAYVYPEVMQLEGKKNDFIVQGLSSDYPAEFDVGNVLKLSCTANIGSLQATTIRWKKTSEIGLTDEFIGYQPQAGSFDEGTAIKDNQCGYTRVATITYNTTVADANRENNLAFECYVSVSGDPYGTTYTTQNNKRFYVKVNGGDETPSADTAKAGSGDAGIIAGSVVGGLVLIVIIVLLVYFLWYRRRNSGEDYTTKEEYGSENPNMAPPVDTYASVDKHRNRGHENRGLDEPHETRRHNYENGPGKSNYAMDRDADDYDYHSRDGSPTRSNQGINHMGMDPHGRIGTGV